MAREELGAAMFEEFVVCLWCIWYSKNKSVMEETEVEGSGSVVRLDYQWAIDFLGEFHEVQNLAKQTISPNPQQPIKWKAPGSGRWKVNSDATVCVGDRIWGVGAVIQDDTGGFKALVACGQCGSVPILEVEAMALRLGLLLAVEMGLPTFEVETDSLSLIKILKSQDIVPSYVGLICEDIKLLLSWVD